MNEQIDDRYLRAEKPSVKEVFESMNTVEPYTVGELSEEFDNAKRWSIRNRLEKLYEAGVIERKKHAQNRVSYWVEPE